MRKKLIVFVIVLTLIPLAAWGQSAEVQARVKLERANQREVPVIDLNGFYQVAHGDTSDLRFVQVKKPELPDFPEFQSENLSQPEKVGRELAVA